MHADGCDKPALTRLMWLGKVGEPPGDPNHNIGYNHDIVEICPTCHGATVERLRHDCFDYEDVWDQYEWYELAPDAGARLRDVAARCDQPLNPFCNCETHKSLRTSMNSLPSSSWDAIFETEAHRHMVRLTAVGKPRFELVPRGVASLAPPPKPDAPKATDKDAVLFVVVAWPVTFVAGLWLWFRFLDLHWLADAAFTIAWLPSSFVLAGAVLAGAVLALRKVISGPF